jgi:hypothetical protein
MNNPNLDAGIPILTEVIPVSPETEPEQDAEPALARQAAAPAPATVAPAVTPTAAVTQQQATPIEQAVLEWDEERWDLLEREIRERVLYQVMEQIDGALEQRVRDSLADVLQVAVEGLASDLKGGLRNTIKDVVTRAVSQEITKLQNSKK